MLYCNGILAQPLIRQDIPRQADETSLFSKEYSDKLKSSDNTSDGHGWHYYTLHLKAGDRLYIEYYSHEYTLSIRLLKDNASLPLNLFKDSTAQSDDRYGIVPISSDGSYLVAIGSAQAGEGGKYSLTLGVAPASASVPAGTDVCSRLGFLAMHEKLDYEFLKGRLADTVNAMAYETPVKLFPDGAQSFVETYELGNDDYAVVYTQYISEGTDHDAAVKKFNESLEALKQCLQGKWVIIEHPDKDLPAVTITRKGSQDNSIDLYILKDDDGQDKYDVIFTY